MRNCFGLAYTKKCMLKKQMDEMESTYILLNKLRDEYNKTEDDKTLLNEINKLRTKILSTHSLKCPLEDPCSAYSHNKFNLRKIFFYLWFIGLFIPVTIIVANILDHGELWYVSVLIQIPFLIWNMYLGYKDYKKYKQIQKDIINIMIEEL